MGNKVVNHTEPGHLVLNIILTYCDVYMKTKCIGFSSWHTGRGNNVGASFGCSFLFVIS